MNIILGFMSGKLFKILTIINTKFCNLTFVRYIIRHNTKTTFKIFNGISLKYHIFIRSIGETCSCCSPNNMHLALNRVRFMCWVLMLEKKKKDKMSSFVYRSRFMKVRAWLVGYQNLPGQNFSKSIF